MKTAMILAAGRGERLKPLTNNVPKALASVHGKPLIEHHIINLVQAGYKKIVINHAYLGDQIRHYIGNGDRWGAKIDYSPEPPGGLETGGGIVRALPLLGNEPFLVVNSDIFTDFNFSTINLWQISTIHLILINKNPSLKHHGDFGITNTKRLTNSNPEYTFAGIACYNPQVFNQCKQGRYSITPLIRSYAEQEAVSAEIYDGLWYDIGSPERLHAANNHSNLISDTPF